MCQDFADALPSIISGVLSHKVSIKYIEVCGCNEPKWEYNVDAWKYKHNTVYSFYK